MKILAEDATSSKENVAFSKENLTTTHLILYVMWKYPGSEDKELYI